MHSFDIRYSNYPNSNSIPTSKPTDMDFRVSQQFHYIIFIALSHVKLGEVFRVFLGYVLLLYRCRNTRQLEHRRYLPAVFLKITVWQPMVTRNTFSLRESTHLHEQERTHTRVETERQTYTVDRHNVPQFVKQDSEAAANKEHIYGDWRHKTASQAGERSQSVLNNHQRCQAVRIWGNLISGGRW